MKSDFSLIKHELNKLADMPPWGRIQGDQWDQWSNFIYRVKTLRGLQRQAQAVAQAKGIEVEPFANYAIRRWYNHHTHDQILQMFYAHPDVQPETNRKHQSIDFYLRQLPFDLKISRFPRAYPDPIDSACQYPRHLAMWQYQNQSTQGRYHTGNRLFIVLHYRAQPEQTWQLRRDFENLQILIEDFLSAPILLGLTVENQQTQEIYQPWSGVIFHIR